MKRFFCLIFSGAFCLQACNSQEERYESTRAIENEDNHYSKDSDFLRFYDSLAKGYELNKEQIIRFTSLDSVIPMNFGNPQIWGETVLRISDSHLGAVINYSDGIACLSKYLLVFTPEGVNTDLRLIYQSCDGSEEEDYEMIRNQFNPDSSFDIITVRFVSTSGEEVVIKREQFVFNQLGKIINKKE